jgi:hypothetical protein
MCAIKNPTGDGNQCPMSGMKRCTDVEFDLPSATVVVGDI